MVVVPLETVFFQVPALATEPAGALLLLIARPLLWSSSTALLSSLNCAELFRWMLPPLLPDTVLVPCNSNVRASIVKLRLLPPVLNVAPPTANVFPEPLSVALFENDVDPFTVSVPVPVNVPPDCVSDAAEVLAASRLSVPAPTVTAPRPVTVPCRSAVPPATAVAAAT